MNAAKPAAGVAFVALTRRGLDLARRLQSALPGAQVHGLQGRADGADIQFADTAAHLRELFVGGRPIIAVCAAGIVIRSLAAVLSDKRDEPPVLSVSEDGASVVPLLGGHGGANRLAAYVAEACGGRAAVTTAGDVAFGLALDEPPPGWRVANPEMAKPVTAALLAGQPVELEVEAGDAAWLTEGDAVFGDVGEFRVLITARAAEADGRTLVLHPPVLAVGVGCERGAAPEELVSLAEQALSEGGLAADAVACVVSLDLKEDEPAVHAVATHLDAPARFFPVTRLEAETPRLANPSNTVFGEVGCHGVAEGAALAAIGDDGGLAIEKKVGKRTTCAVGRAPFDLDPALVGRARGHLSVVGIGPGPAGWRTPRATRALGAATDVVGYGLYLDLVGDVIAGKERHQSPLSAEEDRVRLALDLAAEGRQVALVSSGDAGIYALAALVFELLEREDAAAWNRLDIVVEPGVSAMQAAAARIGAPLGHDFCAISLSDLLTPWEEIERRLGAAAAGDFVVAFYNPVSKRRRHQLEAARDTLLGSRGPETPVVLARNVGRAEETIEVIGLQELSPDRADMLTMIVVGNSQTRTIARGMRRWVYTPRGYASKMKADRTGAKGR